MNRDYIDDYLEKNLSAKRRFHTYAVKDTALKLAKLYGVDSEKTETAALLHDICKNLSIEKINEYVKEFKLDSKYENNINLAHSKIAAKIAARDFNISDCDIINAVSYHTTGRAGMSLLEKIIYIADAIEPGRSYQGVEDIRKAAFVNLDEACLLSLSRTADYVKSQGAFLDEDTADAARYLKELKYKGDSK